MAPIGTVRFEEPEDTDEGVGSGYRISDIGGSAKSELDLFGMPVFYGIPEIDPFGIPGFYGIVTYFPWWKWDVPMGCSPTNTGP